MNSKSKSIHNLTFLLLLGSSQNYGVINQSSRVKVQNVFKGMDQSKNQFWIWSVKASRNYLARFLCECWEQRETAEVCRWDFLFSTEHLNGHTNFNVRT